MEVQTWFLTYAIGPLMGALAVGLAPPIRRRVLATYNGVRRILKCPDRVDDLEERFSEHEHTPVGEESSI